MDRDRLLKPTAEAQTELLLSQVIVEFLVACKSAGVSPRTQHNYTWCLNLFKSWATKNGVTTIDQVTGSAVRNFIASRAENGDKPASLHTYFRTIRTLCLWMVREGLLQQNPVANVKAPKLSKDLLEPLTLEQIQALDKHLCNTKDPYVVRNRALVFLLLDTGIRVDECAGLRIGAFFPDGTFIVDGKGSKQRVARIGATGLRYLNRYLNVRGGQPGSPLWIGERGPMTTSGLMITIQKISRNSGVKFSAHTLRRTFAIFSLRNGMDPISLKNLLGHESLDTTLRYVKQLTTDLVRAHEQFSPLDRLNMGEKLAPAKKPNHKPDVLRRYIPTVKAS